MKTTSGKIKRRASKEAFLDDKLVKLAEWQMPIIDPNQDQHEYLSTNSLKDWLIDWISFNIGLQKSQIDPDIAITNYGLDSLMLVQLERDVNKTFNVSWPIESFLKETNINQLVEEGEKLLKENS